MYAVSICNRYVEDNRQEIEINLGDVIILSIIMIMIIIMVKLIIIIRTIRVVCYY